MISVYKIKPAFQRLLQPLLKALYKLNITANQISVVSIFFSIGLGILLLQYPNFRSSLLLFSLGLLIRMALNALDGMMARTYNMQSKLGEVLNELGDIISDIAIIFPLMILPGSSTEVIIIFGILAIINEYAGLLGKVISGERRYDGPMGKSDRALLVGLFCLIYYFWDGLDNYMNWVFGIASVLIVVSTLIRIKKALKR